MTDLDELRRLANETTATGTWGFDPDWAIYPRDAEFIAAASPAVVLDLIARAEKAEAQVARVRDALLDRSRYTDAEAVASVKLWDAVYAALDGDA